MGFIKSFLIFIGLCVSTLAIMVSVLVHNDPQSQATSAQATAASCKQVIMYSMTTCGACKIKKHVLANANIPFTAYETDKNPKQNRISWEKAKAAGWGRFGVPVLEVNGKLFRSTVTVDELRSNLC